MTLILVVAACILAAGIAAYAFGRFLVVPLPFLALVVWAKASPLPAGSDEPSLAAVLLLPPQVGALAGYAARRLVRRIRGRRVQEGGILD